jgi:hypothetical protein
VIVACDLKLQCQDHLFEINAHSKKKKHPPPPPRKQTPELRIELIDLRCNDTRKEKFKEENLINCYKHFSEEHYPPIINFTLAVFHALLQLIAVRKKFLEQNF